ncbi:hypothetical protein ABEB36_011494 [Hypothenemus hampei]|uniref:EB domain-containing protein n=1 Tax=Hypothenemus hampei TaxID=57062 RepID=A0ABD1EFM0_HYPHA
MKVHFRLLGLIFICFYMCKATKFSNEAVIQPEFLNVCFNHSDCQEIFKNEHVLCINSLCKCNDTFCDIVSEEKVTRLGEPCNSNLGCQMQNAICLKETCQCPSGKTPSSNKRKCLKVFLHANCTKDDECNDFNEIDNKLWCNMGSCSCRSQFIEHAGFCTSMFCFHNIFLSNVKNIN